ncbi:DoxX family protein [Corynebacterium kroppenstedtii]|uniref:DoxX family protein n=1 Tax=Corynebacterium sp. PCR 32 TaxID=3351342 RepID=UPI00309C3E35
MNKPEVRDAALLLLRIVVGLIFIAHGWDKAILTGLSTTGGQFDQLGIPQPELLAALVSFVEMISGAMIVIGILAPAAAAVLIIDMMTAMWLVHLHHGFFVANGGVEFAALLVVTLIAIAIFGAGRASLDYFFQRRS